MKLKISYKNDEIEEMYKSAGVMTEGAAGFDLLVIEDTIIREDEYNLVDHGIVIKPEKGHHTFLLPRSSTAMKYGLTLANSIGLIDGDYCKEGDTLKSCFEYQSFCVTGLPEVDCNSGGFDNELGITNACKLVNFKRGINAVFIPKGTRLSQIILQESIPFELEKFVPEEKARGGFGSTGK